MSDPGGSSPRDDGADAPSADVPPPSPPDGDSTEPQQAPTPEPGQERPVPSATEQPLVWYLRSRRPLVVASRDVISSVLLVLTIGLALFAVSGVWPPLVAVESGSMQPNMARGDLVVVVDEDRFSSQLATEDGVVTAAAAEGTGHASFGEPGSVIVYRPDGDSGTPIIHRAAMYVEEGDRWVSDADPQYLGPVDECTDVPQSCPAPYDGYVTLGDANPQYDQISGQSTLVRPEWIQGRAVGQLPYLGCIRLALSDDQPC